MLAPRYRLEEELGRGGSGAVFRARDCDQRLVAVKRLAATRAAAPATGVLAALRRLSHPNIAAVHDCGEAGGDAYVLLEYAPGCDLRAHARPGRLLPLATVLSIGARIADALAHAHARGVVHGDVSPGNIVFDAVTDSVKLVDFALEAGAGATPAYSSPEQVCGLPATSASDQFSLGVTLYVLTTGVLPFNASSRPQLAHAIVNEPHRSVREVDPALPAPLAAVLDRAMAKRAWARYAGADELAMALRAMTPLRSAAGAAAA